LTGTTIGLDGNSSLTAIVGGGVGGEGETGGLGRIEEHLSHLISPATEAGLFGIVQLFGGIDGAYPVEINHNIILM